MKSRIATLAVAVLLLVASPVQAADCEPADPTQSALIWQVEDINDAGAALDGVSYWQVARSRHWPGLTVPLPMYGSGGAQVLDWVTLPRYGGSVGLLQYVAGSAGTSRIATFVNNVVVDLARGEVLGAGNLFISVGLDCRWSTWTWIASGVIVEDDVQGTLRFRFRR